MYKPIFTCVMFAMIMDTNEPLSAGIVHFVRRFELYIHRCKSVADGIWTDDLGSSLKKNSFKLFSHRVLSQLFLDYDVLILQFVRIEFS